MTGAGRRPVTGAGAGKVALKVSVESAKRKAVERVLAQTNGNVAEAAAILGIVRPSLYRIMKRYGIANPNRTMVTKG